MALTIKMQIDEHDEHQYYFATGDENVIELIPLVVNSNGIFEPDEGKAFSKVTVSVPETVLETLVCHANGTYTAPDGKAYDVITVDVSAMLQNKNVTITQNGTRTIECDEGYDGLGRVTLTINVPNTYTMADEGKVVELGALTAQTTRNVTQNGTYDTTSNNETIVNVPNTYTAQDEGKVVQSGSLVTQGTQTITQNGTYDTTLIKTLIANISAGAGGYFETIDGDFTVGNGTSEENKEIDVSGISPGKSYVGMIAYFDENDWSNYTGTNLAGGQRSSFMFVDVVLPHGGLYASSIGYHATWTLVKSGATAFSQGGGSIAGSSMTSSTNSGTVRPCVFDVTTNHIKWRSTQTASGSGTGLFPGKKYKYVLFFK